ncbi:MAG: hypothetical protein AB1591_07730 [Pseudomonadota bacterium]
MADGTLTLDAALEGKPFRVILSAAAQRALAARGTPLVAEMELYFSCLIRLQVRFHDGDADTNTTAVTDKLAVRFRPVVGQRCDLHAAADKPPLMDAPLSRRAPFVPRWLRLDHRKGEWLGEFGHTEPPGLAQQKRNPSSLSASSPAG